MLLVLLGFLLISACRTDFQRPSLRDAEVLAREIEQYAERRDPTLLNFLFSRDAFLVEIEKRGGGALPGHLKAQAAAAAYLGQYGTDLMDIIDRSGSCRLMHIYGDSVGQHLLFRIISAGRDIDYWDFLLLRADGEVKAADLYTYSRGMWLSETILYELALHIGDPKILPGDALFQAHQDTLVKIGGAMKTGHYKSVLSGIEALPRALQMRPAIVLLALGAAAGLQDIDMQMQTLRRAQQQDSSRWALRMMEMTIAADRPEEALAAIELLDKSVGGDPYLDYYRARCYHNLGNAGAFVAAAQQLLAFEPAVPELYFPLIESLAVQERVAEAHQVIAGYRGQITFDQGLLDTFLASQPALPPLEARQL